jgi:hypothetical protein
MTKSCGSSGRVVLALIVIVIVIVIAFGLLMISSNTLES